jgi:hypothetical protein
MTPLTRGVLIAVVHVALVAVVGGVLLYERNTLPSVWALTTGVDPVLPIRGRYVSLRLVVEPRGELPADASPEHVVQIVEATMSAEDGRLVATVLSAPEAEAMLGWRGQAIQPVETPSGRVWTLVEPIAFFLPEDAPDPTVLAPGEELWAEVTVPHDGLPRPIRLEVR